MLFTKRMFSIPVLLILVLMGCDKNENQYLESDDSEIILRSGGERSEESINFFDMNFTNDSLALASNDNGYYQIVEEAINFIESEFSRSNFYQEMERNGIYPCWICAESENIGFHNYYVPFYSLETKDLDGLLVVQKKNEEFNLTYVSNIMVKQVHFRFPNDNSQYWSGIMEYFTGGIIGKSKKPKFNSRSEYCKILTFGCRCSISYEICGEYLEISEDENNGGGSWDCAGSCNGDGEGDGDDEGGDDDDDNIGPDTVADIGNWSTNPGGGLCCGGPPVIIDPIHFWYEHCGSFDGSLDYEENEGGEFVIDESTGTISLMNPNILYTQQIQSFIDHYNMSNVDPQEIAQMAGEMCAVSTLSEVFDCLKCQYITPLGLSGELNYYLNDNFEIVGECNGDINCIKSELVENSDCAEELVGFISHYGLDLTLDEKFAILSETGGLSGNCSNNFVSIAKQTLFNIKIDMYIDLHGMEYEDENFNIYDIVPLDCALNNSFNECASDSIDSWFIEFLKQVYPELQIPTHEKSFPMTKIGNAYYCETNFINLGFWHEFNPTNWVAFCVPHLCIQIPTQNTDGPFNIHDVPRNMVKACDAARSELLIEVWDGDVTTTASGREAFLIEFEKEIAEIFNVSLSNVSLNESECNNEASSANYGVDLLGKKASPKECVYD